MCGFQLKTNCEQIDLLHDWRALSQNEIQYVSGNKIVN